MRTIRIERAAPMMVFMIAALACSLTGTVGAPPDPAASPAAPETHLPPGAQEFVDEFGEPVVVELPPPDLLDMIVDETEDGTPERRQAIVDALRLLTGERAPQDVYPGRQVRLGSGFMVSSLAYRLYHDSDDPDLKAELERLWRVLAPDRQALEPYSQPADGVSQRPGGLASLAASARRQTGECAAIVAQGFPPGSVDPPLCYLFVRFEIGGNEYRIYYPAAGADDPRVTEGVGWAEASLRDSHAVFSRLAEMRDINVIFSIETEVLGGSSRTDAAFVPGLTRDSLGEAACPIVVFPLPAGVIGPRFQQVMAHEVFHCVQLWLKGDTGGDSAAWYMEGSAEYFSNVVYPTTNNEYAFIGRWDAASVLHSILDMEYETVFFFMHLGNAWGDERVIDLIRALPAHGDQRGALAGVPGMDFEFHDFAIRYLDRQIRDTGGGRLPLRPLFPPVTRIELREGLRETLEAEAFQVARYTIVYPEATQIRLTLEPDGEGQEGARPREGEGWDHLPLELTTSCDDGDEEYIQLLTTTENEYALALEVTEYEEKDCCVVGTWVQGTSQLEQNLRAVFRLMPDIELREVNGQFVVEFLDDGTVVFKPEGYEVTAIFEDGSDDGEKAIFTLEGASLSRYRTIDNTLMEGVTEDPRFVFLMTDEDGNTAASPLDYRPFNVTMPFALGAPFPYVCTDTTLTVTSPPGATPFSTSIYTRLGEAP